MRYSEAVKQLPEFRHLIGSSTQTGFVVTKVIIVPSVPSVQDLFLKGIALGYDPDAHILRYVDEELEIWAIDERRLTQGGLFMMC